MFNFSIGRDLARRPGSISPGANWSLTIGLYLVLFPSAMIGFIRRDWPRRDFVRRGVT